MAKFRTNHGRNSGQSGKMVVRVGLFAAIVAGLFYIFQKFTGIDLSANAPVKESAEAGYDGPEESDFFLPASTKGELVRHKYFSLSYDEEHEVAEWVAYALSGERLELPWVDRADEFVEDPAVGSGSATWADYSGSGYDRGHLVPAADMAFSDEAMRVRETFFMSNICPQARHFNGGIWRELEEQTRSWAKKYGKLYVVSGPVLTRPGKGRLGRNEVTIPSAYYKVLLDLTEMPTEISYEPLFKYAASVDEVEKLTGIDFFADLMTPELEEELEGAYNTDLWTFSKAKFETRVREWNSRD
jgi:endonuclease G